MFGMEYDLHDEGRTAFFDDAGFVVFTNDSKGGTDFEQEQVGRFVNPSSTSSQVSTFENPTFSDNESTATNFPNFENEHPLIRSKLETFVHYVHMHFNSTLKDDQLVNTFRIHSSIEYFCLVLNINVFFLFC